ncbi:hypothetical protein GF1_18320 [Desulfolithobacter dissulfuricans]|uniref:Uncharacterized protein n=1 Tax=Desulfolithobacter dissulfuricans TaxID=2795293 RepID=A0A915U9Z4_9BACT|nr:hypothetical protein GF1_18320 [Desulfolithobacter dissulfuricans]
MVSKLFMIGPIFASRPDPGQGFALPGGPMTGKVGKMIGPIFYLKTESGARICIA